MVNEKIFISHSHKDKLVADAFVNLLAKSGLDSANIISSSTPKAQFHTGARLYEEIRTALSNPNTLVIFLLSENFYSSVVCMNEMGAAWVTGCPFHTVVLPDFSFEKIKGVITENSPVGISLSSRNETSMTRMKEVCREIASRYGFTANEDTLDLGITQFFSEIEEYKKQLVGKVPFSMRKAKSFCVNDTEHDGCRIWQQESDEGKTTAILNFDLTTSSLCSIVYRIEQQNWKSFREEGKSICFEIRSNKRFFKKSFQAEVELHFPEHNEIVPFTVTNDSQSYRIPLSLFDASAKDWENVKELCFLFRKKPTGRRARVVIEHLRLENN